jgi:hypothetical protein
VVGMESDLEQLLITNITSNKVVVAFHIGAMFMTQFNIILFHVNVQEVTPMAGGRLRAGCFVTRN